jgi:hypothetical protein
MSILAVIQVGSSANNMKPVTLRDDWCAVYEAFTHDTAAVETNSAQAA